MKHSELSAVPDVQMALRAAHPKPGGFAADSPRPVPARPLWITAHWKEHAHAFPHSLSAQRGGFGGVVCPGTNFFLREVFRSPQPQAHMMPLSCLLIGVAPRTIPVRQFASPNPTAFRTPMRAAFPSRLLRCAGAIAKCELPPMQIVSPSWFLPRTSK